MQIRRAAAVDNERILAFQAEHAMQGSLPLRFDRGPDYFGLLNCHSQDHRTWLAQAEDGAPLKGLASLVVRPGYLQGVAQPVAYLGDLRATPNRQLSRSWMDFVQVQLAELGRADGVRHAYCCLIRDNLLARRSLLTGSRRNKLGFTHWHGYSNISIYSARSLSGPANPAGLRIVRASAEHLEALCAFLDKESREQPFGSVFSQEEFSRRLQTWPDFGIASFMLALDRPGNIVGCVAPWDASSIKRIVLERLPPNLQAARLGFNLLSPFLGRPPIAAAGQALNEMYLTHVQISKRDPAIFSLLLDAVWRSIRRDCALLQLCLFDGDPLWRSMQRFRFADIAMDLYTLATRQADNPPADLAGRIPGFEIYLV